MKKEKDKQIYNLKEIYLMGKGENEDILLKLEELEILVETSEEAIYKYENNYDKLIIMVKLYHDLFKKYINTIKKRVG